MRVVCIIVWELSSLLLSVTRVSAPVAPPVGRRLRPAVRALRLRSPPPPPPRRRGPRRPPRRPLRPLPPRPPPRRPPRPPRPPSSFSDREVRTSSGCAPAASTAALSSSTASLTESVAVHVDGAQRAAVGGDERHEGRHRSSGEAVLGEGQVGEERVAGRRESLHQGDGAARAEAVVLHVQMRQVPLAAQGLRQQPRLFESEVVALQVQQLQEGAGGAQGGEDGANGLVGLLAVVDADVPEVEEPQLLCPRGHQQLRRQQAAPPRGRGWSPTSSAEPGGTGRTERARWPDRRRRRRGRRRGRSG